MNKTDLSKYDNSTYNPGSNPVTRFLWYFTNLIFFQNPFNPVSKIKVILLKIFGAKIGKGVVIKPSVNIKYPWRLTIGDYSWIGENVWIDNLADVEIGANCCISQGAMLLCGNHNYKKSSFDLITGKITLEEGVWIGAESIVSGNIICRSHSVLSVNSVASKDLESYAIYRGNPAERIKTREISEE
jgi:putative colanic acid biosynthesis acetyltransferase WcaF